MMHIKFYLHFSHRILNVPHELIQTKNLNFDRALKFNL